MIELTCLGGARTVTGSKHLLRTSRATVLLECGLFQGRRREANARNRELDLDVASLDAVILSHAHIDHSGALPVLTRRGHTGPIYATPATRDLCAPMLLDAASIQASDARHIDRLIARGVDLDPVEPLYDADDVTATLARMIGLPYHRPHVVAPGVTVTFLDAGHVLGSAIVVLDLDDDGERTRLVFTGDLGRRERPILRDPEVPDGAHALIMESTYGDRLHAPFAATNEVLAAAIRRTAERGGKVIIPSFALERAQEVVFALHRLRAEHRIPAIPVYVDSPLAVKLTEVFKLHPDCFDRETYDLIRHGQSPFDFDGLRYVTEVEASKAIDAEDGPSIVIAGSGMCEGGRVLHHLRTAIEDPRTTIVIVGFQAEHTLGRRLVEHRPEVRIFGVMRSRAAEIVVLDGMSAHADQADLIEFAEHVRRAGPLRRVILVHGEPVPQDRLAAQLGDRGFAEVVAPERGARLRL